MQRRISSVFFIAGVILAVFSWAVGMHSTVPSGGAASAADSVSDGVSAVAAIAPAATTGVVAAADTVSPPFYRVVAVVDGDTIKIFKDGATTTVRLIGIDTPETVKRNTPVQCYGPEASAKMHALLDGAAVRIETDPTQDLRDKYGRLLAYVFMRDGTLVDELLIERGFGREYTFKTAYQYQAQFRQAEMEAQAAGRGLWAADTCAGGR